MGRGARSRSQEGPSPFNSGHGGGGGGSPAPHSPAQSRGTASLRHNNGAIGTEKGGGPAWESEPFAHQERGPARFAPAVTRALSKGVGRLGVHPHTRPHFKAPGLWGQVQAQGGGMRAWYPHRVKGPRPPLPPTSPTRGQRDSLGYRRTGQRRGQTLNPPQVELKQYTLSIDRIPHVSTVNQKNISTAKKEGRMRPFPAPPFRSD